jgi:hypothetical protein
LIFLGGCRLLARSRSQIERSTSVAGHPLRADTSLMTFEVTELAVSPTPGLRMQVYTPSDATTALLAARRT